MLPLKHRLPRAQFPIILGQGKRSQSSYFLSISKPSSAKFSRFGIVVSSKVAKSAVTRNQIKRRLRSAITSNLPNLKHPVDIILITKPAIIKESYSTINSQLQIAFSQLT